jgi:hypothetical protein
MNIQEAKEKLKKDGFTIFELADFDKDFYDFLLPLKCNNEKNLKDKYAQVRANVFYDKYYTGDEFVGLNNNNQYETYEEASGKVYDILNKINNTPGTGLSQLWYYSDIDNVIEPQYTLPNKQYVISGQNSLNKFKNYIENIVTYFFDFAFDFDLRFFFVVRFRRLLRPPPALCRFANRVSTVSFQTISL